MKINITLQKRIDVLKAMVDEFVSNYSCFDVEEVEYSDGYHVDCTRVEFTILWGGKDKLYLAFDISEEECLMELDGEDNWASVYVDDDLENAIFGTEEEKEIWREFFFQQA